MSDTLDRYSSLMSEHRGVGTGAATRILAHKLDDMVSVKDFGAVGDGDTDDTAALQRALDSGRGLRVPAGVYNVTAPLTVSDASMILDGEGPKKSVLLFHGCNGVSVTHPAAAPFPLLGSVVRDLAFQTTGGSTTSNGFLGLSLNGSTGGFGRQFSVINCNFTGASSNACWARAIDLDSASYTIIDRCLFTGNIANGNLNFDFQDAGIRLMNVSTDVRICNSHFYYIDTAIYLNGDPDDDTVPGNAGEGVTIRDNHIVLVNRGVWSYRNNPGNYIVIEGNHIAAKVYGVLLGEKGTYEEDRDNNGITETYPYNGSNHSQVNHNLVFKRGDSTSNFVGIQIASDRCAIIGNEVMKEDSGASGDGTENGIVIEGGYCRIASNSVWNNDGAGIWLKSTANHCTVVGNVGANNTINLLDDGTANVYAANTWDDEPSIRGCLVYKNSDQPVTNGATPVTLTWDVQSYDHGDWFTAGDDEIIVPAGVTLVELRAGVWFDDSLSTDYQFAAFMHKNGAGFAGAPYVEAMADGAAINLVSAPIQVQPGDTFTVRVLNRGSGAINVKGSVLTWFSARALA